MPRPSDLPNDLAAGPFHVATALASGLTRGRLRGHDLAHPFYAVRSSAQPATTAESCRAYLARLRPGNVFSHLTAARLWGMPLPLYLDHEAVHVTCPAGDRAPAGRGVVGHALGLPQRDVTELHGLPVTSPVATWFQGVRSTRTGATASARGAAVAPRVFVGRTVRGRRAARAADQRTRARRARHVSCAPRSQLEKVSRGVRIRGRVSPGASPVSPRRSPRRKTCG